MRELLQLFPALANSGWKITSRQTNEYNCIAWAANDENSWWWPDPMNIYYWPESAPREETISAFRVAFSSLGFEQCDDGVHENGYEKIALFIGADGKPSHMARQLPSGNWTSKIGGLEDIEHPLEAIEGKYYGNAKHFLKRKI